MPRHAAAPRPSQDPLYRQVRDGLARRIAAGEWPGGARLPPEPELAAAFGVSIATLRTAVAELEAAGILTRQQGRGTFLAQQGATASIYRWFRVFADRSDTAPPPRSEILSLRHGVATRAEAAALGLGPAEQGVVRVSNRLRLGDAPVQVSDVALPARLFPGLTRARLAEAGETLYSAYQRLHGIIVVRVTDRVKAASADAATATQLGIAVGEPVLDVERLALTFQDQAVEWRRTRIRSDRYHLLLEQGSGL